MRWTVTTLVLLGGLASAQPAPDDRPWAAGVPEDAQARALELYTQGNTEFAEARFSQALAKYREALVYWDHPAIEFNIAVCLINLDQPIEARQALAKSVAYGPTAIGPQMYAQALADQKLLDGRLAFVKISCREPQAVVSVDGNVLFVAPGSVEQVLLPGSHQIVASKAGFATVSEPLTLTPGKQIGYDVRLVALASTTHVVRRWPVWQPWAVLGAGAVLIGVGEIFHSEALEDNASYNRALATECAMGCPPSVTAIKDHALREDAYSLTTWAAAGVITTLGIAAVVLNEPQTVAGPARAVPSLVPVAGGAMLSVSGGF